MNDALWKRAFTALYPGEEVPKDVLPVLLTRLRSPVDLALTKSVLLKALDASMRLIVGAATECLLDEDVDTAMYQLGRSVERRGELWLEEEEKSLIFVAFACGDTVFRDVLSISKGVGADSQDIVSQARPLHYCMALGDRTAILRLASCGVSPWVKDRNGVSPLDLLILGGFVPGAADDPVDARPDQIAFFDRSTGLLSWKDVAEVEAMCGEGVRFTTRMSATPSYMIEYLLSPVCVTSRDKAFRARHDKALWRDARQRDDAVVVAWATDDPEDSVGWGLFANKEFDKGDFVCRYAGELDAAENVEDRSYCVQSGFEGVVIDARHKRSLGAFVNHCDTPNVVISSIFERGAEQLMVTALRKIKRGEQLLHDYTKSYFDDKGTAGMKNLAGTNIDLDHALPE